MNKLDHLITKLKPQVDLVKYEKSLKRKAAYDAYHAIERPAIEAYYAVSKPACALYNDIEREAWSKLQQDLKDIEWS